MPGKRVLVLPDMHIPYHDKMAILQAVTFGRRFSADSILINGDACDIHTLSRFETDPREKKFGLEIEMMRLFFKWLREVFPKAAIIYKMGNHDERYDSFMIRSAPELIGVDVFEWSNILKLAEHRVTLVKDKRPIQIGDLTVIHGHEYRFAISNPVNPARGLFLRSKSYAMCSHFHQSSYHTEKTINDKRIATWSTGCLCDLHPRYLPFNNWSHGFACVEVFNNNKFNVENKIVSHGKVY